MTSVANTFASDKEQEKGIGTIANPIKFGGQDYKTLKAKCLETGLFEDPLFPAGPKSLGYNHLGPNSDEVKGIVWKRPKELCDEPKFIEGGATRTDIRQGILGDCWLLASIASLTLDPHILARVVPHDQNFEEDYRGIFRFQLWQYGGWVDVVVDDRLPTRDGDLLFVHSAERSEFWSALLEKAYAKLHGSYEALTGGTTTEGFEDFTGGISEKYILSKAPPQLFKIMKKALERGSLLGCAISSKGHHADSVTEDNLVRGHAYSITGAQEVHVRGKPVQLVRVRNPWGKTEWTGPWSDESKEWDDVPAGEKAKLCHAADDGEFWMSFEDFKGRYTKLEICNLTPDSLASKDVHLWNCYQIQGTWKVGSTAGGCLNYPDSFCSNPQYVIKLDQVDDDPQEEGGCTFLVALMQKVFRNSRNAHHKRNSIGFAIYKMPDEHKGCTKIHLGPEVLLEQGAVAMSSTFINAREVCDRFCLPPGEYVIVPSTFDPDKKGKFLLRVFSEKEVITSDMEEDISIDIDEPEISDDDDVDPHFKAQFKQIAEDASELSSFELVEALNSAVTKRTDIKTNGFSLETGRHMVNLIDTDGSETVGLTEFQRLWRKLEKYMDIFKEQDKDKSGAMNSHEMREALSKAGFKINSHILEVIVSRYANAKQEIDFDSFMDCLIRLEMLFKMFKTLDKDDSGKIELDLLQWLCLAIN